MIKYVIPLCMSSYLMRTVVGRIISSPGVADDVDTKLQYSPTAGLGGPCDQHLQQHCAHHPGALGQRAGRGGGGGRGPRDARLPGHPLRPASCGGPQVPQATAPPGPRPGRRLCRRPAHASLSSGGNDKYGIQCCCCCCCCCF